MSSILKVDTIQDQNGNLIISKDSGGSGFLSPYASSSAAITYTVTVASKTSAHPYSGVGSSLGYLINGIESPIIEIKGNDTSKPYHYKFDQSDSSNSGHPLLFYNNVGKTTGFSTGVTTNGTPGQAGAYTMIAVDSQTPNILYYQCSQHANMGNHTFATSPVVNTGVFLTLPTADGSSGQVVTTNGSGVLSFANGSVPDDAITLAKMAPGTDGNIISYDASGNPVAVATGNSGQVLTSAGAGAPPTFAAAGVAGIVSNADATALTITDAELVQVKNTNDTGGLLSVSDGDSGATASADANELVLEDNGSAGMSILTFNNTTGNVYFGDGQDNDVGKVSYNHSTNALELTTNGAAQWSLDSSGNFLPAATDHGIYLGTTSAAGGNLLDDYEEGTWTPVMTTSGGSLSGVQYSYYNKGWYTKVGRNVTINFNVGLSNKGSNGSGAVRLSGYPFSSTTLLTASVYGSLYMYNGGVDQPTCTYGTFQNHQTLRYVNAAGGGEITWSDISNNSSWSGMMTFITNQ